MSQGTRAEAERIAARFQERNRILLPDGEWVIDAIVRALQARDERAIQIVKDHYEHDDDNRHVCMLVIEEAIRKDTP